MAVEQDSVEFLAVDLYRFMRAHQDNVRNADAMRKRIIKSYPERTAAEIDEALKWLSENMR